MARYPQLQTGDAPVRRDLDGGWTGVDNRRDRGMLAQGGPMDAPGLLADAINVRIGKLQPETRRGCVMPKWLNPEGAWPSIQGLGLYSAPNGEEWVVVAAIDKVWLLANGRTPRWLELPPGEVLGQVEIVQAFDRLLVLRGPDEEVLSWSGVMTDPLVAVRATPVPEESDYTSPLPGCAFGLVMADRFFFPVARDTIGWSDILDFTRYDADLGVARFNAGEDDAIVALARYQGNRLIVFKRQSIFFLNSVFGDLSEVTVDRLPARIGCVARRSVAEVGGDLMWLGDHGVYRLSQTEQDALRSVPVPVSQPVQGWIDRINWNAASGACATVVGGLFMLAVPLDAATRNNAILVYDVTLGTWQGLDYYGTPPPEDGEVDLPELPEVESTPAYDQSDVTVAPPWPAWVPVWAQGFVITDYAGERTAVMSDGLRVLCLGHGTRDRIDGRELEIYTRVETRGYLMGELGDKAALAVEAFVATRAASLTLAVRTDGVNELLEVVTDRMRDRQKSRIHGRARYDLGNAGGDFEAAGREDYTLLAGDGARLPAPGVRLELWQEFKYPLPVRRFGRWFSVRAESRRGQMRLLGVQVDALPEHHSFTSRT